MRRVGRSISTLLLLLLLASILISCQNARRNADFRDSPLVKMGYETYADGNDAIGFPYNGSSNYIAESDTGYYFLYGNFVYYMDRDRMIPVLLDQQLRENDLIRAEGLMNWSLAESTAYFANPSSLYYFGDKLYLIADESPVRGSMEQRPRLAVATYLRSIQMVRVERLY